MSKIFAKIISTILNPLVLLVTVPYILVLKSTNNYNLASYWSFFSFIFIIILSVFILIGIRMHYFSDLDISEQKQRPLLFSSSILLCLSYIFSLYIFNAPKILFVGIFALLIGLTTLEIINKFTKVSIHVATISAFVTSLFLFYNGVFIFGFLLIPLVAWARIKTHNHTKLQTFIGACIGVITTLSVYAIFEVYS